MDIVRAGSREVHFKGIHNDRNLVLELAILEGSTWTSCERSHAKSTSKTLTTIEF